NDRGEGERPDAHVVSRRRARPPRREPAAEPRRALRDPAARDAGPRRTCLSMTTSMTTEPIRPDLIALSPAKSDAPSVARWMRPRRARIRQHWRSVMATKFVTSADGTRVAYETMGQGAPLVFVWGALGVRSSPFAKGMREELAKDFAVFDYDRRGRGGAHAAIRRRRHARLRVPRRAAARDPRAHGGPRGR